MKVLVLCDDFWHPARVPREGLAALGDCGFTFDFLENSADWSAEKMNDYPLVIFSKSNNVTAADPRPWMNEATEQAFEQYVHAGGGLLVVHFRRCRLRTDPHPAQAHGGRVHASSPPM